MRMNSIIGIVATQLSSHNIGLFCCIANFKHELKYIKMSFDAVSTWLV